MIIMLLFGVLIKNVPLYICSFGYERYWLWVQGGELVEKWTGMYDEYNCDLSKELKKGNQVSFWSLC